METSTPRWSAEERAAVIRKILAEMRDAEGSAPFVKLSRCVETPDFLTEELTRSAITDLAENMRKFGELYGLTTNCVDQREAGWPCAHQLSDWGYRLTQLVNADSATLARGADEIINGNPAKYQ